MHIGFLTNEYPPLPSGGIGTSIRNLARALVRSGHRVTVLGWGRERSFEDQGVRVKMLGETTVPNGGWLLNRLQAVREIKRLHADEGLDLVEAPDWCGMSAGMALPCPLVIRCHGSAVYFAHLLSDRVRPLIRFAERLALRQADAVAAVSRFTGEETRRLFSLRRNVEILHNGIDMDHFRPGSRQEADTDTILYLGTIVRKKGVLDLCRIFSRVTAQHPTARFILVGRDSRDEQTGAPSTWGLCRNLLSPEAAARTEYLGSRPYHEVQEYVRRALVCVFPSYAEAMPLAWLEAMACARPLVCYDVGWAPEVVENNVHGIRIPAGDEVAFADAVLGLLRDPECAFAMGEQARRRAEAEFSAEVAARRSVTWYQRIIEGRGS